MTKKEIAQTIVDICKHDASFCKDIQGGNADEFLSEIAEEMDEKRFLFSVERYLASFGVRGHLCFYRKGDAPNSIGFRVRQYQGSLFVTYAEVELPLSRGDEIVAIDGNSIPKVAERFRTMFCEETERCGDIWEMLLSYSDHVTVKRGESTFEYAVRTDVKWTKRSPYLSKNLSKDCFYIRLDSFGDEGEMQRFLNGCREEMGSSKFLIIDVRQNTGGSDIAFLPLLKYCLKEDDKFCGKPVFTSAEEVLYTDRNVENRVKLLSKYLESAESEETRRYLRKSIEEQIRNRGKGFVAMHEDGFLFASHGTRLPEQVIVLTDCDCASSGESFVEIAAKLDKVTVIGRPTMGICDYSNLAFYDFGEYVLNYPTSRSKAIDEGRGTRGRGLQPDVLVHWSPKHLLEDVDLAVALALLGHSKTPRST